MPNRLKKQTITRKGMPPKKYSQEVHDLAERLWEEQSPPERETFKEALEDAHNIIMKRRQSRTERKQSASSSMPRKSPLDDLNKVAKSLRELEPGLDWIDALKLAGMALRKQ
jgi:hypothetical protein